MPNDIALECPWTCSVLPRIPLRFLQQKLKEQKLDKGLFSEQSMFSKFTSLEKYHHKKPPKTK